jgi:hypothetical protein
MKRTNRNQSKIPRPITPPPPQAPEQPMVLSAREAARLWGNWSDDLPRPGQRYRPPYCKM